MIVTLTWLAVAITALVLYLRSLYSKFSRHGVNHLPIIPLFGNIFWVFAKKEHMFQLLLKTYNAFSDDNVIGHYDMVKPVLLIRNMETLKKVAIKDFEHFVNRRRVTPEYDPLFGRGMLMLTDDEWKAMRSVMSPSFTSSKMKMMFPFIVEVGEEMNRALRQKMKESGKPYIDIETKDLMSRFANDVIASCACGLKMNSQKEDNEFYAKIREITKFKITRIFKVFLYRRFPLIAKMLRTQLVPPKESEFFKDMVLSTMEMRKKNHIVRHDMINILMEIKKAQEIQKKNNAVDSDFATFEDTQMGKRYKYEWSDTDLVAQAALFVFAGFDTIAVSMSFLLYELALHPDVQDRLVKEIREHDAKHGGNVDFTSVQEMPYLDMVISESLRLWPAAVLTDRLCDKDYNIGKPNNKATQDYIIRKNDVIVIPILAFHRDPNNFPEPNKFDPERFSPENKNNIKPLSFIPFGVGPRNCIGSRFALLEMKLMLCALLREMELYPCEKTCVPPEFDDNTFDISFKGGCWVRVRVRPEN